VWVQAPRSTAAPSAGRIGGGAARRYHLVAVTPLDLRAMLTADRPRSVEMQKGDHVIFADLGSSLPLRHPPYLSRAHPLGHHNGVVPHVRAIGHSATLRQVRPSASRRHAHSPNRDRHVPNLGRNHRHSPLTVPNGTRRNREDKLAAVLSLPSVTYSPP
jgi:hypothetical protein